MSTETATATTAPALSATATKAVSDIEIKNKIRALMSRLSVMFAETDPAKKISDKSHASIAKAIAAISGVTTTKTELSAVLGEVVGALKAGTAKWEDYHTALEAAVAAIEVGSESHIAAWEASATTPGGSTAAPKRRRKRADAATGDAAATADGSAEAGEPEPEPAPASPVARVDDLPPIVMPPIPSAGVTLDASNPMSSMAVAMAPLMKPMIETIAAQAAAAVAKAIGPVLAKAHENTVGVAAHVNRVAAIARGNGSGTIDKSAVESIVDNRLGNGAGEEMRRHIAGVAPALFTDLLGRAADAVASTAPASTTSDTLHAAFEPVEDPLFLWEPQSKAACYLLEASSAVDIQNAMIVGPTGAGKTDFAFQFAAKTKRKMFVLDCANVREARDIFGMKGARGGSTYFQKSQFWLAVEAGDCVILLDEFNRAPDHVRNTLYPLLDHRRRTFVEEVGESLVCGTRVVFLATMNEGLEYTGTHSTDRAMENRFIRRIEMRYLPPEKEVAVLLTKAPGIKKEDAARLVDIANVIREKASVIGGGLSKTVSTRQLITAAQDFVIGGPKTLTFSIVNHYSQDGGADSERVQVIQTVELKGYKL